MVLDDFAKHQRAVASSAEANRLAVSQAIRACVPGAVAELLQLGATRVILFGSVARDEASADSDLDLAVTGLPAEHLFTAMARAARAARRPVDLVRLEEAPNSLRSRIEAEGEVLVDVR
ncbi:MAG: nucleotidyltransferase domain-containing protein [Planctomycetes bacterium]|nr:nucleotidyltransferase domain-containing protein [Planctomycetota bacterium]